MNEFTIIKLSPVGKPMMNNDEVELRVIGIILIILIIIYWLFIFILFF